MTQRKEFFVWKKARDFSKCYTANLDKNIPGLSEFEKILKAEIKLRSYLELL